MGVRSPTAAPCHDRFMDETIGSNSSSSSPRWEYRRVMVRRSAGGQKAPHPKGGRFFGRPPRNPREPLTISVKYRGGPECWYEIHARGCVARFPGYVSIHEIMDEINTGGGNTSIEPKWVNGH